MGRRSFLDKQRALKRWDDKTLERIKVTALLDRLQQNALNDLPTRPSQVRGFLNRLAERWGVEKWNQTLDTNWAMAQLLDLEMSMAQVKSAEVLLRKALPDLAQVESKQDSTTTHIVMLPETAQSSDSWGQNVANSERALIEHDGRNGQAITGSLEAPTRAANLPADVPGP